MSHRKLPAPQGRKRNLTPKVAPLTELLWGRVTRKEQSEIRDAYVNQGFRRMSETVREVMLAYARSEGVRDAVRVARTIAA
jgi:hypothetical protein